MSVYANLFLCFIILCFSAYVSLYSVVLLIFEYGSLLSTLLVLLFESVDDSNGNCFGLSVFVRILILNTYVSPTTKVFLISFK